MMPGGSMKRAFLVIAAALAAINPLAAQTTGKPASAWSLSASPSVSIPLLTGDFSSNSLFSPAWGGSLGAEYALRAAFPLSLRLGAAYSVGGFLPAQGVPVPGTLSEALFLAGAATSASLAPKLSLHGFLELGLAYGSISTGKGSPYGAIQAGGGLGLMLSDSLSARLDAVALYKFGLYGGLGATLGLGYRLPERAQMSLPAKPRLLELTTLDLKNVFPIFRSYYDEHPVGTARITNTGKEAATNARVSFIIRQYMDAPKECASIERIEPGASIVVPLYGLFNDRILDVTEATKVSAEVSVEYNVDVAASRSATVLVYDRNALTWSDDRHAAAFVSSKDPWVLDLTGNILAAVKGERNSELAKNLQTAIAFHEGLRAYGISYVLSPNRPFAKEVLDPEVVDTLKFPRQTLTFRAGDCADLSVLYASCFEAAGIESAFITVPGHIFMAIDLGLKPAEARAKSMDLSELVVQGERAWLPIETTMRDAGFVEAWKKAALEWRDASAKDQAAVFPLHEAWKTYAPVGLPADGTGVTPPASDKVIRAFRAELAKAVDAELGARLAALGPAPSKGAQAAKSFNDRGVLYGRYGRLADAERDFKTAAKDGFVPAIVNLGNVSMLKSDPATALGYFQQASKLSPGNAKLLVSLARSASALGKGELAASTLDQLRKLDPQAAERNASLAQVGASGTRAAEIDEGGLVWF
jgi:tetratricopeptide (TPR) repeat protein